jgi:alpha 1,2-mannosyltransferase
MQHIPVPDIPNEQELSTQLRTAFHRIQTGQFPDFRPRPCNGRGIIMCGGGKRLFSNGFVTIKMIRHWGCSLPIQWFYADAQEMTLEAIQLLEQYNVRCFNLGQQYPNIPLRGFQIKAFALVETSFEECIFIDSDNMPLDNVTTLFDTAEYRNTGALFWKDYWTHETNSHHTNLHRKIHQMVEARALNTGEYEWESGQFVIHRQRHRTAVQLVAFINANFKLFYSFMYGDKDTFRLAWLYLRSAHRVIEPPPGIVGRIQDGSFKGFGMIQYHPDGSPLFLHQTMYSWEDRDKTGEWNAWTDDYTSVMLTSAPDAAVSWIQNRKEQYQVKDLTPRMQIVMQYGRLCWNENELLYHDLIERLQ